MPTIALKFPPVLDVGSLTEEHATTVIEVFQLTFAVVIHKFYDINSHAYLRVQDSRGQDNHNDQAWTLVKLEPDLTTLTTVGDALREEQSGLENASLDTFSLLKRVPYSDHHELSQKASGIPHLIVFDSLDVDGRDGGKAGEHCISDLTVLVELSTTCTQAFLSYESGTCSGFQAENTARSLSKALESVANNPGQYVSDINLLSEEDQSMINNWNRETLRAEDDCLHRLVERTAQKYPDKTAISSWDGQLTYRELDSLANWLASYLVVTYSLGPETKVPVCFEKSSWAIVGMLGVLKAGAAYCCLDPDHPRARHDFIIKSVGASVILASPNNRGLFDGYPNVVCLDSSLVNLPLVTNETPCTTVGPENTCLIAFTSGSTGVPKGIVHTHTSVCTGLVESAPRQGIDKPDMRVFQWAAYTFDVALTEVYVPLIHGGCVCIPSEDERLNDVEGAMNRMGCEWAFFTPTFSRFFRRYNVPTLKIIAMGGEAAMDDDINAWVDRVKVLQVYGPAECVTWYIKAFTEPSPRTISFGRPTNVHGWIVDPKTPERLLPVGAVGELLMEGPAIFIEYLNDAARNEACFLKPPKWRKQIGAPCANRIYKSGDLVRYLPNGEMTYVGRKDAMVKLRGQRIDLDEIEHLLRVTLEDTADVAVDLITPSGKNNDQTLVAFICLRDNLMPADTVTEMAPRLQGELRKHLPEYMVPRMYYPIELFPYNASKKLDRKALRQFGSALTTDELLRYSSAAKNGTTTKSFESLTPHQNWLRLLWGEILKIRPENIELDDNFFALGGSSLAVLRLIASARDQGYLITYTDMFKTPSLREVAAKTVNVGQVSLPVIKPYTLIPHNARTEVINDAVAQCHVSEADIEDVFPLTPQQEGLWALSLASDGSYVAQFHIRLSRGTDPARFQKAWGTVVDAVAFMRTRIIQSSTSAFQVVLKESPQWSEAHSVAEYCKEDRRRPLDFGEQPTRFALIKESSASTDQHSSENVVIWTSHHALYDGHSVPLFLNAVAKTYRGEALRREVPFTCFIRHLQDPNEQVFKDYWRSRYSRRKSTNFPKIPHSTYRPIPTGIYTRSIHFSKPEKSCITDANVIRAALALTIAQVTGVSDVNYLETLDGRSVPVAEVESIIGPTFNTIPRNTLVNDGDAIEQFLSQMQTTSAELMPYAQYGLQNIRHLSAKCAAACEFQSILVIEQTYSVEYNDVFDFDEGGGGIHLFNSDCIMWKCNMHDKGVDMILCYDGSLVSNKQMRGLVNAFEENIHALCDQDQTTTLAEIESLVPNAAGAGGKRHVHGIASPEKLNGNGPIPERDLDETSRLLRDCWVQTLGLRIDDFNIDDDFFSKGGNSIRAMEFVAAARRSGVSISVAKIFRNPTFADLAKVAALTTHQITNGVLPTSLIGSAPMANDIKREASLQCRIDASEIEEIIAVTPLQANFMASTQGKPGAWMTQTQYVIPEDIPVEQFQNMWEELHKSFKILRSRMIKTEEHGVFQVIARSPLKWAKSSDISDYLRMDRSSPLGYGDRLARYAIINTELGPRMVLSLHHSIYDGFTLDKLLYSFNELLHGRSLSPAPSFRPFIEYLKSVDRQAEKTFWQNYLDGYVSENRFPLSAQDHHLPTADTTRAVTINLPTRNSWPTTTTPTIMLAAWAKVISRMSGGEEDIAFGTRVSGRSAPVESIMDMLEPTIAHVPVRVKLSPAEKPVGEFLQDLQKSAQSEVVAYEQAGLDQIASMSKSCRAACGFQNMLVIQRATETGISETETRLGAYEDLKDYKYFNDWALLLDVFPSLAGNTARLVFCYDSSILGHERIDQTATEFEWWIAAFASGGSMDTIGGLSGRPLQETA